MKSTSSYLAILQTRVGLLPWKVSLLLLVLVLVGCQGQTFQYSRGWTNGKRAGGYPAGSPPAPASSGGAPSSGQQQSPVFDMDNGLVGVPLEDASGQIPLSVGGNSRMSLNNGPQGRLRSLDYAQYLSRKLSSGNANSNRKQPMWIVGLDQEANTSGDF